MYVHHDDGFGRRDLRGARLGRGREGGGGGWGGRDTNVLSCGMEKRREEEGGWVG